MRAFIIAILLLPTLVREGVGQWSHVDDSIFKLRASIALTERYDTLKLHMGHGDPLVFTNGGYYPCREIAACGKLFLGTPYVSGTLDMDTGAEHVVINLHGFDCVTFYENALALARSVNNSQYANYWRSVKLKAIPDSLAFEGTLERLRYRDGKCNGYHSRLHYTIDYFYDNNKRRLLSDVTRTVGRDHVQTDSRTINFMTDHRKAYKQLANDDAEYAAMRKVERDIHSRGPFAYIPKVDIPSIEKNIMTGDILGITTNIDGLDCSHTGIAVRMPDGRIHFMHASSLQGKVIITEEPLADYLSASSHQTGIIIARPAWPLPWKD
jgi:hypothetical protein